MEPSAGAPYEQGVAASQWGNWRARASGVSRGTRRDRQWLGIGGPEIIYPTKGLCVQTKRTSAAASDANASSGAARSGNVNMCGASVWRYADSARAVFAGSANTRLRSQRRPTKMRITITTPNGTISPKAEIMPAVTAMRLRQA